MALALKKQVLFRAASVPSTLLPSLPAVRFVIVAAVCFVSQFTALLLRVPPGCSCFGSRSASASPWELSKVTAHRQAKTLSPL